jgi:5-methylcytosine-specific restriction endonuclease McrA
MPKRNREPWHDWYSSRRWQRRARYQRRLNPLCALCLKRGRKTLATVTDHVVPHKGDPRAFWFGALQSLCKECHDGEKNALEIRGFSDRIGEDGMPLDPRHVFYTGGKM